jgi:hypothetical protein
MDPHSFSKLDPVPHKLKKLDPEPVSIQVPVSKYPKHCTLLLIK